MAAVRRDGLDASRGAVDLGEYFLLLQRLPDRGGRAPGGIVLQTRRRTARSRDRDPQGRRVLGQRGSSRVSRRRRRAVDSRRSARCHWCARVRRRARGRPAHVVGGGRGNRSRVPPRLVASAWRGRGCRRCGVAWRDRLDTSGTCAEFTARTADRRARITSEGSTSFARARRRADRHIRRGRAHRRRVCHRRGSETSRPSSRRGRCSWWRH